MILTRSPLRITIGGGGPTDMPSYYMKHGGFTVAAAIDKYVYITLHRLYHPGIILKYAQVEHVQSVDEIKHPLIRESLRLLKIPGDHLEMTSMADIPSGSGLGSSSSFTTALLRALHAYQKDIVRPDALAEEACTVEIERAGEPIGKQDQYASAIGGITAFTFHTGGVIDYRPVRLSEATLHELEDRLLLFFTGFAGRAAGSLLRRQDERSRHEDPQVLDNLQLVKKLSHDSLEALEAGDLARFGHILDMQWRQKENRSPEALNDRIRSCYRMAKAAGAVGGKLVGAGGGGFLMFLADDRVSLRLAMERAGLQEMRFRFDFEGTKLLQSS